MRQAHISVPNLVVGSLDVVYGVQQLYIGLLVATRRREAAALGVTAAEARLQDTQAAVSAATVLPAVLQAALATRLERRQDLLTLDNQIDDLRTDLNDMLGLALETPLDLAPLEPALDHEASAADTIASVLGEHPNVRAATAQVDKRGGGSHGRAISLRPGTWRLWGIRAPERRAVSAARQSSRGCEGIVDGLSTSASAKPPLWSAAFSSTKRARMWTACTIGSRRTRRRACARSSEHGRCGRSRRRRWWPAERFRLQRTA